MSAVKVDRMRAVNKGGTTAPRPFEDKGGLFVFMKEKDSVYKRIR